MRYRVTYRPETSKAAEDVDADAVRVEAVSGHVVLVATVLVIGQPREVVVRRLAGQEVLRIDPV